MQDEITSDLARFADLKVVGSQSTGSYVPSKERDLRAIGPDLGVRYLLEGDVWRANSGLDVSLGWSTLPRLDSAGENPWRRWIDTSLDSPRDIVEWETAQSVPGYAYRTEARSVVLLFARV